MISKRQKNKLAKAFLARDEKKAQQIAARERRRQEREAARQKRSRDSMGKGNDGCAVVALTAGLAVIGVATRLRGWS